MGAYLCLLHLKRAMRRGVQKILKGLIMGRSFPPRGSSTKGLREAKYFGVSTLEKPFLQLHEPQKGE
jgi:hypothetical protein